MARGWGIKERRATGGNVKRLHMITAKKGELRVAAALSGGGLLPHMPYFFKKRECQSCDLWHSIKPTKMYHTQEVQQ